MSNKSSAFRPSKLTPAEESAAKALGVRFDALKTKNGMTKKQFAIEFKVPGGASMISQNISGARPISLAQARAYMRGFECTLEEIAPAVAAQLPKTSAVVTPAENKLNADDNFADVPRIDVCAAAGHGCDLCLEEEVSSLKFRRDFLRSIGVSEKNATVITVRGASMEPTIADGAVLLVNRANREPHPGAIYVFHVQGNGLVVKRVVKKGEQWMARSDNDDREAFPDFGFDEGATLIGRAVWMGAKL